MNAKQLTWIGLVTGLVGMGGCGPEGGGERPSAQNPPPQVEERPASREDLSDRPADPGNPRQQAGAREQTPATAPAPSSSTESAGDAAITEFAALDVDANGILIEQEWRADSVGGVAFEQVDGDDSGTVEPEEFRRLLPSRSGDLQDAGPSEGTER